MEDVYIPLLSAFVGAIIGALASIGTVWIQAKTQANRDRVKHAAEMALFDYKTTIERAEKSGKDCLIPPISTYLHYHHELTKALEKSGINPEVLARISEENDKILKSLESSEKVIL